MRPQFWQRVALQIGSDVRVRAITLLVVRARMAAQPWNGEMYQRWSRATPHVIDAFLDERGRLRGVASVAVAQKEIAERRKILRDIATRRLHLTLYRDAEPVVFDVEEHRQLERGGHRERGPESVRGHTRFTTE